MQNGQKEKEKKTVIVLQKSIKEKNRICIYTTISKEAKMLKRKN